MGRRIEHPLLAGPAGPLECQLVVPSAPRRGAALLCHPHPQHGGTMHTKALHRAARALESVGLPVLRFNFRGVGRSAGHWTGGSGERDDARAALELLAARYPGEPLVVGGFSFGSWVGLEIGRSTPEVQALVGIAPPLDLYDFGFLHGEARPLLLVAGDRDPFCPTDALRALATRIGPNARLVVLPGAAHLLTTHLGELEVSIRDFATRALARL